MARIGFIGLGIMGTPMARRLQDAGHALFVHARGAVPAALLERGATACADAAEVASRTETVFLMLPDTPQVEAVLFGPRGVAEGTGAGKTVVDMSSIAPLATKDFARRVEAIGADWLDAPVSGGEVGAKAGTLSVMAGGRPAVFERIRPLLDLMGRNVTLVGGHGDGQTCKVANQIVVALNILAVSEALLFAARSGADPARVRQALLGGFASSRVLEVHGERMLHRAFEPGFRIDLHRKDLGLALDGARALGVPLPATAVAQQLLNACAGMGLGGLDHSALCRALEAMAGATVAPATGEGA